MNAGDLVTPRVRLTVWATPFRLDGGSDRDFDPTGESAPGDLLLLLARRGGSVLVLSPSACGRTGAALVAPAEP